MNNTPAPLMRFINKLILQKVNIWSNAEYVASTGMEEGGPDVTAREYVTELDIANVVTSRRQPLGVDRHALLLDIDVPAWLIPSTTEGHTHFYADVNARWDEIEAFLDAGVKIGLLEPGYVAAAKAREMTAVRLPWVKKEKS